MWNERKTFLYAKHTSAGWFAKCTPSERTNEHNSCNHNLIGIVPFFVPCVLPPASSMKIPFYVRFLANFNNQTDLFSRFFAPGFVLHVAACLNTRNNDAMRMEAEREREKEHRSCRYNALRRYYHNHRTIISITTKNSNVCICRVSVKELTTDVRVEKRPCSASLHSSLVSPSLAHAHTHRKWFHLMDCFWSMLSPNTRTTYHKQTFIGFFSQH